MLHKFLTTSACLLAVSTASFASEMDGTTKDAWSSTVGWLNAKPSTGGVLVYHDHLAGYVWSSNLGWIKLSSGGSGPHANTTRTNWGVNKATDGSLSGYGWSTTAGWINFGPTQGGVRIANNSTDFTGTAWGENIGWIQFAGTATDTTAYVSRYVNTVPSNITISTDTLRENMATGTTVGTLSCTDEDDATWIWSLVTASTDFEVVDNVLQSKRRFDYETATGYSIDLQAVDGKGARVQATLSIQVSNQDESFTIAGFVLKGTVSDAQVTLSVDGTEIVLADTNWTAVVSAPAVGTSKNYLVEASLNGTTANETISSSHSIQIEGVE